MRSAGIDTHLEIRGLGIDTVLHPADPIAAADLEQAGFGRAWVTETTRDPYLCLASAAGVTRRLGLATGVTIAFARSPMTTAQSAHDVQRVSRGRLWLGLGSQVRPHTRRFSMTELVDEEVLQTFAVVAQPDQVLAAVRERFGGEADRVIVHSALDPGPDVWRAVLTGARDRAASAGGDLSP